MNTNIVWYTNNYEILTLMLYGCYEQIVNVNECAESTWIYYTVFIECHIYAFNTEHLQWTLSTIVLD